MTIDSSSKVDFRPLIGGGVLLASFTFLIIFAFLAERLMHPDGADRIEAVAAQDSTGATRIPLENGRYRIFPSESSIARLSFRLPEATRTEQYDILVILATRRLRMEYCGQPLVGGEWDTPERYKTFRPHYLQLQDAECDDPEVDLVVDGVREPPALRTIYFGKGQEIEEAYRWRRFLAVDFTMVNTGLAAVSALVAFASLLLARRRKLFAFFGGMMAIWTLRNIYFVGPLSEASEHITDLWFYSTTYLLASVSAFFVNEWTFRSKTYERMFLIPATVAMAGCLGALAFSIGPSSGSLVLIGYIATGACLFGMLSQYVYSIGKDRNVPLIESFLLLVAGCAGLFDLAGQTMPHIPAMLFGQDGLTIPYSPLMPALAAIAILIFVGRENRRVRSDLISANNDLESKLTQREAEARRAFAESAERSREASILRERQRIMEDIHDGFGNRLLAISLQVERGELDQTKLSRGLQDSLRDLRLIVDSMDTADGDLSLAFGALRGRIEPELIAQGIELDWQITLADQEHGLGPRAILSLYRIIQEATTNTLRHSGATRFEIRIDWIGDDLVIAINDNGKGLPAKFTNGHGIQNIRNRAKALGGEASIQSVSGTSILLRIPASAPS